MKPYFSSNIDEMEKYTIDVGDTGYLHGDNSKYKSGVRPVITIHK